jgi:hypothetical protein
MDIDLGVIPDSHKGEFRSGWYPLASGLFVSPLAMAKHRMTGDPRRLVRAGDHLAQRRLRVCVTQLPRP